MFAREPLRLLHTANVDTPTRYELALETDHQSGQLRHPAGGPYLFIAERPLTQALQMMPADAVKDTEQLAPPSNATLLHPFEEQHWRAPQMRPEMAPMPPSYDIQFAMAMLPGTMIQMG